MSTSLLTMPATTHHVAGVSFDDAKLQSRRRTLGASEIPAVAGLSRYRSPLHVWLDKMGRADRSAETQHTEWGHRLEPVIAAKYADLFCAALERPGQLLHPVESWMSATPDAIAVLAVGAELIRHGLECKNRSVHAAEDWGVSGTDQVPHDVAAQCHWSMLVSGMKRWDVAVLIGGNDWRFFALHFDAEIAAALQQVGYDFWHNHVLAGVEPPVVDGSRATHEYLAKRFRQTTDVLLPASVEHHAFAQQLLEIRSTQTALDEQASALEAQLKAAIGEAAGLEGLGWKCTWKAPAKGQVAWKSVAETLAARFNVSRSEVDALIAEHTGEPSRRFLLSTPKAK